LLYGRRIRSRQAISTGGAKNPTGQPRGNFKMNMNTRRETNEKAPSQGNQIRPGSTAN
jgi:hypothetical protein